MQRRNVRDPRSMTLPRAGLAAVLLGLVVVAGAPDAGAAPQRGDDTGYVAVIEVSGLLDRVLVDFVETQIDKAEEQGAIALVLQLNSGGAVVDDERLDQLVERIEGAAVPVDVWVGPSGSKATGEATADPGGGPHRGRRAWQPHRDHPHPARRRLARRRGGGGRQGQRRRRARPRPGRQRRADHRRVHLRRAADVRRPRRGRDAGRGRRPPARHPDPLRRSCRSAASCCTPCRARRSPTCSS